MSFPLFLQDFDTADDPAANADVLLHFMKYAYAIYGSSLYMISPRYNIFNDITITFFAKWILE